MAKIIGLDLKKVPPDLMGACGWLWKCYNCRTSYCSGCNEDGCPDCNSMKIAIDEITDKSIDFGDVEMNNPGIWSQDEINELIENGAKIIRETWLDRWIDKHHITIRRIKLKIGFCWFLNCWKRHLKNESWCKFHGDKAAEYHADDDCGDMDQEVN